MQTKRIRTLHIIIILLIIVTMISLTFAGAVGALYVKEVGEVGRLQEEKDRLANQVIPVLSVDVEDNTTGNPEPGMDPQDMESAAEVAAAGEDVPIDLDDAILIFFSA